MAKKRKSTYRPRFERDDAGNAVMPTCQHCGSKHWPFVLCPQARDASAARESARLEAERKAAPLFIDRPEVRRFGDQGTNYYQQGGTLWLKDPPPFPRFNPPEA